ncbi:fibroblast growth factor-binding protein 1 [Ambystoma mexicanum]|uniref:fibroblast growth factor-binding protein 1 n=1 Tax=Ambystoma mexicanum TaxID=8296 RepID=UPI0037E7CB66
MEMKRLGLACVVLLVSQLLLAEGNNPEEGKRERKGKGNAKGEGEKKGAKPQAEPGEAGKDQKSKGGRGSPQGKFSTKDKAECTWVVSEANTGVSLRVECTKGGDSFRCEFAGNPSACPEYTANQKHYWKQISRALKKQKNICQDPKAMLKSKECKKAPKEAHLSILPEAGPAKEAKKGHHGKKHSPPESPTNESKPAAGEGGKECVEDVEAIDQRKVAEEYCGESWSSFCTFFFSMLQNKKC